MKPERSAESGMGFGRGLTAIFVAAVFILLVALLGKLGAPRLLLRATVMSAPASGNATESLRELLQAWEWFSRRQVTQSRTFAAVVALAFAALLHPRVQRALDEGRGDSGQGISKRDLSAAIGRPRVIVIYSFIGALLAGSLMDIALDAEHWPFSQYAMYSETLTGQTLETLRLVGVTREGSREVPLFAFQYIQPFDQSRLRWSLETLMARPGGERLLRDALANCLDRYEALRRTGRHDGPALRGMRLYRLYWTLDPEARNFESPDRRELLGDVPVIAAGSL